MGKTFFITGILLSLVFVIMFFDCPHTPPLTDDKGNLLAGSIATMEEIDINGIKQAFLIRGVSQDLPVLLVAHGGLGTPYSALSHTFRRDWEKHFIVVHWDQRGSGKLYKNTDPNLITSKQLLDDTRAVAEYLNQRFNKKIYILGHSWGSYLAFRTVAKYPELFEAYIGVGQNVGILKEDTYTHKWVLDEAKRRNDTKTLRSMEEIGLPPYDNVSQAYGVKYPLIAKYGGLLYGKTGMSFMVWALVTSPEYSLVDVFYYVRGISNYEKALLKNDRDKIWQLSLDDISQVSVPVYFIYGENDQTTPGAVLKEYTATLKALMLSIIEVKNAAHFPFIDQKDEFTHLLVNRVLKETAQ